MEVYSIGHSTHTKEQFLKMLKAADIEYIADIRAFPASRRYPQFKKESMSEWLEEAGYGYSHFPDLGGEEAVIRCHRRRVERRLEQSIVS